MALGSALGDLIEGHWRVGQTQSWLTFLHWTMGSEDGCNAGYHITACFFAGLEDKFGPGIESRLNFKLKAEGYA